MDNFFHPQKVLEPVPAIMKLQPKDNVVFVAGVFDILHMGHVDFLRKAKNLYKNLELVVVIHSDVFVREKKGHSRPYMTQQERAELLSELDCVDYVVIWDGWENITDFAESVEPKYFAVTEKSFEHSNKGKWQGQSWYQIAEKVGANLELIKINSSYSSSKYKHIFD